ncbi:MAG: LacI family transcriptional regulator [Bryobacteraceae bacterium]|nr:LacI family transcriptional regulator [Bryobacteraceae bacterium]
MTLAEVARRAGVSAATVSRVLSGSPAVKPSMRERVLTVVRQVNYLPNVHAQALAGGRSRTLGMIVSNIENPFFLGVFMALEEHATQQEYEVLVEHTGYRRERLVASIRSMLKRRVEGLAVIVSEMDRGLIEELAAQDVPVVFYDVGRPARNITSIRVRYDRGTQRTAEYLYSLGHRRFGFVGHHAGLGPLEERKRTFTEVMERFGKGVRFATASGMDSPAGGRHAAGDLLSGTLRPTAILCANDHMAVGVLRELHDRGLRVPDDVSVAGFDNIGLAEHLCPSLTTVRIPQRMIGQLAFEALMFGDAAKPRDIVIEPELIVRESSGPAPGTNRRRRID